MTFMKTACSNQTRRIYPRYLPVLKRKLHPMRDQMARYQTLRQILHPDFVNP